MKKYCYVLLLCFATYISPIVYGQNGPLTHYENCIISDMQSPYYPGYISSGAGAEYILVEVIQNKVTALSKPFYTYVVSCPGDIDVKFLDSYPLEQIDLVRSFWEKTRSTYVSSKVEVTVTPLNYTSGPIMRGLFDIMNNVIVGGGSSHTYRSVHPGELTKVRVRMDIHPFYFYSDYYDKNLRWELYSRHAPIVSVINAGKLIKGTTIYPYMFSPNNPCVLDAYETRVSPAIVDFGNVGKKEIEAGSILSKNFSINITRNRGSCGEITSSPKVYFLPQDSYDRNNIYLDNGLMMTFKDENNRQVPLAEAFNLGKVTNNKLKKTIHVELKKGTRGKAIKSGPFSSTVIYLMEYY